MEGEGKLSFEGCKKGDFFKKYRKSREIWHNYKMEDYVGQLSSMNFFLCRQVLIISDLLFTVLEGSAFRISIFSSMQRQHFPNSGLNDLDFLIIENFIKGIRPSSFNFHTQELSVVEWAYFLLLQFDLWFPYLSLNVVAVNPIYCLSSIFSAEMLAL